MKNFFDLCKERGIKPYFKHGIWFPVIDDVRPVVKQEQQLFTEGANTNYELWQMEKHGNYVKAQGSEYAERFIDNKNKSI